MEDINTFFEVLQDLATRFGLNLIAAIVIFFIGLWAAKLVRRLVRRLMSKGSVDPTLTSFVGTLTYYGIIGFALIASLNRLGVQTASLIALLGAAGLAVGLALQGSLSNFSAGVLIVIFRPFNVGDWVKIDDVNGHVEEIHLLTTSIVTLDHKRVIVPNADLMGGKITNYTVKGKIRVDAVIGVAYDADIDQVKSAILDVLKQDPLVLPEPQPVVAVIELGDSSVNFTVRPWARPEHYWQVYFNIHENVKKRLDAEGIVIPFPQRDVHIYQSN